MKSLLLLLLASGTLLCTSCNTLIGVGRDMRLAGEGMENVANKANGAMGGSGGASSDQTGGAPVY